MNKEAVFSQLKWSLQAMASDSETQISLFPDFIVVSDEIITDFDHWKRATESRYKSELSPEQIESLHHVNTVIEEITRSQEDIWGNDSLTSHELWDELRMAGTNALKKFHWKLEIPSTNRSIFL